MFHSLRWRLQVWHALVLAGVLLTFGSTVYHLQWESRLQQIDAELDRTAEILSFRARYLYPSPWRSRRSPASPIPTGPQRPASQGPGGSRIGPANSAPGDRPAPIFLPDELAPTFDPSSEFGWHYIAWSPDGTLLQKSANAPDRDFPNLTQESSGLPPRLAQTINEFREVIHVTTLGSHILVGRSLSPDLNNQHRSGIILAGLGTTTLLTGILLGNWISRRSLRTIAILSNTAAAIAETNLSQRIPTTGIDLEIQQLAETLNQAFDRLQAAFQRQSRFIADASHELRTPITVIIAQCELALLRSRAESEYRSALDASLRAAQRMHALAESLLTLAEAEASPLGEPAGLVATATAIAQVLEFLTPLSAERNLLVSTRLEDCSIVCRRTVFDRIILNALSNAVRHNIQNGTIQVLTNAKDSTIHIQISNTCNIPPDRNLAELGTPFFRVDPARATSTGGAGLGLAITKELIATLSGTIAFNPSPDNFEVEIILPRNPPSRA